MFDGPDAEFVDGEIVERALADLSHGKCQARFIEIVYELKRQHPLHAVTEVRHRVGPARFRIPDVAIYYGSEPTERIPSAPPFVAVEIISADDRYSSILKKLHECENWGVKRIWIVDPQERTVAEFRQGRVEPADALRIGELGVSISAEQIFG